MSCICQYFVHSKDQTTNTASFAFENTAFKEGETIPDTSDDKDVCSTRSNVSATDMAAARAEIWILRKSLAEARMSIENLESLVKTIIDKQNVMLAEMYHLKRTNFELQDECRMQRDYHTMERNAMIRESHDIKLLLTKRSKVLAETIAKNRELINSVDDANEKIYVMGMKYLKLKEFTCGDFAKCSDSEESDQSEQSIESAAQTDQSEQSDESECE